MEFKIPSTEGFSIYSKSNCSYCNKLKHLLNEHCYSYLEINCDDYLIYNKDEFLKFIENHAEKSYRTFPMVFFNNKFIGGFTDTRDFLEKQTKNNLVFDSKF
jgi:glutaredoxin